MLEFALLALAGSAAATTITTDRSVAVGKTFDYVIAGGGLAGITVGNKVSLNAFAVIFSKASYFFGTHCSCVC